MTVFYDAARQRWRYDFRRHGRRHHGYCEHPDGRPAASKTEAKRIEEGHKAAAQNRPGVRIGTPHGYTWAQACATWLTTQKGKGGFTDACDHVREFLSRPEFAPTKLVTETSDADILAYKDWALDQNVVIYLGGPRSKKQHAPARRLSKTLDRKRRPSSVNRRLDTLRAILNLAHKMRDPATGLRLLPDLPTIEKLKTKKRLPRPMPLDLAEQAIAAAPEHLAHALRLTTSFGFRAGEAFGLKIAQVDFARGGVWLDGDDVKENRDAFLPATAPTMAFLRMLVERAQTAGQQHLVLYRDPRSKQLRPVKGLSSAWQRLRRELGLAGRHTFHNTRGTFAQRLVREKVDPRVTQKLMRHAHASTTEMYYEIEDEMRRAAVEAIEKKLPQGQPANDNSTPTPESHTSSGS